MKSNPPQVVQAVIYRDTKQLKQNYKIPLPQTEQIINKKQVLSEVEPINKKLREEDNIASDNYYDNILNDCLVDAANEVLEKER